MTGDHDPDLSRPWCRLKTPNARDGGCAHNAKVRFLCTMHGLYAGALQSFQFAMVTKALCSLQKNMPKTYRLTQTCHVTIYEIARMLNWNHFCAKTRVCIAFGNARGSLTVLDENFGERRTHPPSRHKGPYLVQLTEGP
eukprot:4816740-Amphidinium_carterae.2